MSEPQDAVQDLMNNYGFEEAEAQAYYQHLDHARQAYEAMVMTEDPTATGEEAFMLFFLPHFSALRNDILRRAWEREHPA